MPFAVSLTWRIKRRERVLHLLLGMLSNLLYNVRSSFGANYFSRLSCFVFLSIRTNQKRYERIITNLKTPCIWRGENRKLLGLLQKFWTCRWAELRTVFELQEVAWDVFGILSIWQIFCLPLIKTYFWTLFDNELNI